MNIKLVIRLNKPKYDKNIFLKAGIKHVDLIFPDGTNPSEDIFNSFFNVIEREKGAVAIHCKAGLGRTGTLIGMYLMKHYRICSSDVIAWLRILRPGSVLGPQQHFLINKEKYCFSLSENSPIFNSLNQSQKDFSFYMSNILEKPKSIGRFKNCKVSKNQGDLLIQKKLNFAKQE